MHNVVKLENYHVLDYDDEPEMTESFRRAVAQAEQYKIEHGFPVARYDEEKDEAYLEYPDGRREYWQET